jgi:hypothetical protein
MPECEAAAGLLKPDAERAVKRPESADAHQPGIRLHRFIASGGNTSDNAATFGSDRTPIEEAPWKYAICPQPLLPRKSPRSSATTAPRSSTASSPVDLLRLMGYARGAYALGYVDDLRDPIEVVRPDLGSSGLGDLQAALARAQGHASEPK